MTDQPLPTPTRPEPPRRRRGRKAAASMLLLGGLVTAGAVYSAVLGATSAQATSTPAPQAQVEQGRKLFLEGCSSCHGLNAQGSPEVSASSGGGWGPSLIGVGAAAVDFQVGTGRMPLSAPGAQAKAGPVIYTQAEIDALAAYVASLGPGPAIPSAQDLDVENANLAEGGELFRTNCAQCHNFAGAGGALTRGKYAPSLKQSTPKHMYEAMLTGPQSMPVFADTTITPEEKQAIIKYVVTLREQPNPGGLPLGRLGPVSEGLLVWVVGIGALVGLTVWIATRSS